MVGSYLEAEDLRLDERERATVDLDQTATGLKSRNVSICLVTK
jgi:hypothetical protein